METSSAVYLARHGETEWSLAGRHTGVTDLPLTDRGQRYAKLLGGRLRGITFEKVYTSPLRRAARTCELAGFMSSAVVDADLVEWNYGEYEGRRTPEILVERPDWQLFRDGCPGGESPRQVAERAARIVNRTRAVNGNVLLFSSGHILRVLATVWLDVEIVFGKFLMLSTASVSVLGYEPNRNEPVIVLWNDTRHIDQ